MIKPCIGSLIGIIGTVIAFGFWMNNFMAALFMAGVLILLIRDCKQEEDDE